MTSDRDDRGLYQRLADPLWIENAMAQVFIGIPLGVIAVVVWAFELVPPTGQLVLFVAAFVFQVWTFTRPHWFREDANSDSR